MSIIVIVIITILILCIFAGMFVLLKRFVLPENIRRKRYNEKLLKRCYFCKKKVPKNNKYIAGMTEPKFNQNSAQHFFHPGCIKTILENAEKYIEIDSKIVQRANHCYDTMKWITEKIEEEKRQKQRNIEQILSEAKGKSLDLFLHEATKGDLNA